MMSCDREISSIGLGIDAKRHLRKALHKELLAKPPQFSWVRGSDIRNVLEISGLSSDESGMCVAWVNVETLTNLNRLSRNFDGVRSPPTDRTLMARVDIKEFAIDFYDAWHVSSTEVVAVLGTAKVLEIFRYLRPLWRSVWPEDAHDLIECGWFENDPIEIFRGQSMNSGATSAPTGFSWSLSRDVAESYAEGTATGVLLCGEVSFEDILYTSMEELEVVVDPDSVEIISAEEMANA